MPEVLTGVFVALPYLGFQATGLGTGIGAEK
jgi:hypothetical protein